MTSIRATRRHVLILLTAGAARAELVYQPQGYGATARKWREAGSDLFAGLRGVQEGKRLIEEAERERAALEVFGQVVDAMGRARQRYLELTKEIEKPRAVVLNKMPPSQAAAVVGRYRAAGLDMPKNEREAAELAASEIKRFLDAFRSLVERIAQQLAIPQEKRMQGIFLAITQELKRICDRLEDLGLNTAELLTTLPSN